MRKDWDLMWFTKTFQANALRIDASKPRFQVGQLNADTESGKPVDPGIAGGCLWPHRFDGACGKVHLDAQNVLASPRC